MKTRLSSTQIFIVAALTSACGLAASQLIVKALVTLVPAFLLAQTVTLVVYLGAMGFGAYLGDKMSDLKLPSWLVRIELGLASVGMVAIPFFYFLYFMCKFFVFDLTAQAWRTPLAHASLTIILCAQLITLIIGTLAGLEFNILLRFGRMTHPRLGQSLVLSGNYVGALVATVIFLWVFPLFNLTSMSLMIALVSLGIFSFLNLKFGLVHAGLGLFCALMLVALSQLSPTIERVHLKARYTKGLHVFSLTDLSAFFSKVIATRPNVDQFVTRYQTADFLFSSFGSYTFFLDRHPQLDGHWVTSYHEDLIHIPLQLFPTIPRKVLILGGGDGVAAGELLKYGGQVERIDLVELDPWMIEMGKTNPFFLRLNERAYLNPKLNVINMDAILYFRTTREKYDAIYADFPIPYEADLVKLYSLELYRMIADHLNPGGQLVLDGPVGCGLRLKVKEKKTWFRHSKSNWAASLTATLKAAGFKTVFPYCGNGGFYVARLDHSLPQFNWISYGFPLKTINAEKLKGIESQGERTSAKAGRINSLFRPLDSVLPPEEL